MSSTTLSSQDFGEDPDRAIEAADHGPVIITDQGRPIHVLLSIEEYHRLVGRHETPADALSTHGLSEIEAHFPKVKGFTRPADLN